MFAKLLVAAYLILFVESATQITRAHMAQCTTQLKARVSNESDIFLNFAIRGALYLESTGDTVIGGLSTSQKSRLKNFYMDDECLPFQELAQWKQWK